MSIINYAAKEINCKIIYAGPTNSGKTANLQFIAQANNEMVTLSNGEYVTVNLGELNGFRVIFHVYAVSGEETFAESRQRLLNGVDGIVFVVDSQTENSNANIAAFQELKSNLAKCGYNEKKILLIIQLNKRDLTNILPIEELTANFKNNEKSIILESVATSGAGVFDTFKAVTSQVLQRSF